MEKYGVLRPTPEHPDNPAHPGNAAETKTAGRGDSQSGEAPTSKPEPAQNPYVHIGVNSTQVIKSKYKRMFDNKEK